MQDQNKPAAWLDIVAKKFYRRITNGRDLSAIERELCMMLANEYSTYRCALDQLNEHLRQTGNLLGDNGKPVEYLSILRQSSSEIRNLIKLLNSMTPAKEQAVSVEEVMRLAKAG